MKAKKRLGMNGLEKELDTGHPARWNVNTTVNRAEPERKQLRGAAPLIVLRLGLPHGLAYGYTVPGVDHG
jgi:hypothetical protein